LDMASVLNAARQTEAGAVHPGYGFLSESSEFADACDKAVLSQLKLVIRPMYSSPPKHGAEIVKIILGTDENFEAWKKELEDMAKRILEVRDMLRKGLEEKGTPGTWNHITDQIGMFSFTGLTKPICERLMDTHHIYLLKSGRISLAGLNKGVMQYMIDSVGEVVRSCS